MTVSPPAMKGKGEHILRILADIPRPRRVAVLLRHAERDEAKPDGTAHHDSDGLQLTQAGHEAARRLGRELPAVSALYLSYTKTPRTRETAEDLQAGFRQAHPTLAIDMGGAEAFLSTFQCASLDSPTRMRLKRSLGGGKRLLREWFDGNLPREDIRPVQEARDRMLGLVVEKLRRSPSDSLGLLVTHDFAIILLRDWLFDLRFEDCAWPAVLDGIVFSEEEKGSLRATWRERTVAVPEVRAHA